MRSRIASAVLALLLLPIVAFGGELRGRIEPVDGSLSGDWQVIVSGLEQSWVRALPVDGEGNFIATDLPAGRAGVIVRPSTDEFALPRGGRMVTIPASGAVDVAIPLRPENAAAPTFNFVLYRGEYYNNKPTEEAANTVTLPVAGTVNNIDFELTPGGGTISGHVTRDGTGTAVSGLIVSAFGTTTGVFSFDRSDAGGNYRITGIPADTFMVAVNLLLPTGDNDYVGEFYDNTTGILNIVPVPVTEGNDTPNINFALVLGGSISGRVTAQSGGAGIPGASVYVRPVGGTSVNYGLTDSNGNYRVRGVAAGNYTVEVSPDGNYLSEFYNDKASQAEGDAVVVSAGSETANINMVLATGGRVTGTVTDQTSSQPLADLLVMAVRTTDNLTRTDFTAGNGTYAVEGLPAGTYEVIVPEIGKWWNNRTNPAEADPVNVTAGATTSSINFTGSVSASGCTSAPEEVGAISGTVTRASGGQPVSDASVIVYVDLGLFRFSLGSTDTDNDGHYTFDCLDPGSYLVECTAPFSALLPQWYNAADSASADQVEVLANRTTTGINFQLAEGATIQGHVAMSTGGPVPFNEVVARELATGLEASGYTDSQGNYEIVGGEQGGLRPGAYKVHAADYSTANAALIPVTLARFTAAATAEGIELEWSLTADSEPAAFQIERSGSPNGPRTLLTPEPLPAGSPGRYVDATASPDGTWLYWLVAIERSGDTQRFGPVVASAQAPAVNRFLGAAPNPARDASVISFQLSAPGRVEISLFDASGRLVRRLLDETRPAGLGSVRWDGRTESGAPAGAGLYFVRWMAGGVARTGRILMTR